MYLFIIYYCYYFLQNPVLRPEKYWKFRGILVVTLQFWDVRRQICDRKKSIGGKISCYSYLTLFRTIPYHIGKLPVRITSLRTNGELLRNEYGEDLTVLKKISFEQKSIFFSTTIKCVSKFYIGPERYFIQFFVYSQFISRPNEARQNNDRGKIALRTEKLKLEP